MIECLHIIRRKAKNILLKGQVMNSYTKTHGKQKNTLNDEKDTIRRGFNTQIDYLKGIFYLMVAIGALCSGIFIRLLTMG